MPSLTSMNGYVELLLEAAANPLTEEQRSFLATVQREESPGLQEPMLAV
jgi:hypothetical protein